MSQIQTPAELASYRARPIKKLSFEAAILERDYFRYQQKANKAKYTLKTVLIYSLIFLISIINAIFVSIYFRDLLNQKPQFCKYYTYSTKYNFIPKCEQCEIKYNLNQGYCYPQ